MVIHPYDELMYPNELYEIKGYCRYNGTRFEQKFPNKWFYQYTTIEVRQKPDWATVILLESTFLTKPDGVKDNFSFYIYVSEEAPAYLFGKSIEFEIRTGKFLRTIAPSWFPLTDEFFLNQSVSIMAGYVPSMEIRNPSFIEMEPNSESIVNITIKNTGNFRSIIYLNCNMSEEDIEEGWKIQCSPPKYINPNREVDFSFTIFSPKIFGNIDVSLNCPIEIMIGSAIEGPNGPTLNGTALINAHCVG